MSHTPKYSVIIPVFNRPDELDELLKSLTLQTYSDFEVVVVEDGSTVTSEAVCRSYGEQISIRYFTKVNSGPGPSRNFGFDHARGEFLVIFDSDCVIPPSYFEAVEIFLLTHPVDAWGGPDRGADSFTDLQRAMAWTMSSVLTTGGIRGGKSKGFQPRSFNMGMSRTVYEKTGGFHFDRYAEDIELSIRMTKLGFNTSLIPDAYVYHRRRTSLGQFFKQVSNFGKGRIMVGRTHPGNVKLTHWFPAIFLLGLLSIIPMLILWNHLGLLMITGYVFYLMVVGLISLLESRSIKVALLSMPAALVQLTGYGFGFLRALFGWLCYLTVCKKMVHP